MYIVRPVINYGALKMPLEISVNKMVLSISRSLLFQVLTLLSLSVWASPYPRGGSKTATLKLAVRINSNGIKNIADADRVRVRTLQQDSHNPSIDATNAGVIYTAEIGVGNPSTYCKPLVTH